MRGKVMLSRIAHTLFRLMARGYSLAEVDLLLALAVVWLGRHDGRYVIGVVVWVCWRCVADKKRGGGVCRRWWVSARCGRATLMWMAMGWCCNGRRRWWL